MISVAPSKKRETIQNARVVIRNAEMAHVPFIRHLSKEAFAVYGTYETLLPEWFRKGLARTLIAEMDGQAVGYVMLGVRKFLEGGYLGELLAIAVAHEHRGCGVGHLLMESLFAMARYYNVRKMVLHTGENNVFAQGLFKKHGFRVVKTKPQFYEGGQTAVMMEKILD